MNEEQYGSSGGVPIFPRKGEQWFECYICGFDFPLSEARRHYKTNRLVDMACDDEKTHSDYMAEREVPREGLIETEQPVTCQGPVVDDTWYGGLWYEMEWRQGVVEGWYNGVWYSLEWYGRADPY